MKRNHHFKKAFLFLFLTLISCSEKIIPGKYRTNFNTYGMFSKTLILDCNGNATMNFQGDMQNNNSYGKWTKEKDTLVVSFDSIKNRNNKLKGEFKFIIKKNKLENMSFTKLKYNQIVELAKASGKDTLKIPSYRKLTQMTNQNMKDFNGKMQKQHFKKIEELECK